MSLIKNQDLKLKDIPKTIEEDIPSFSHTFNGYEFAGSFEGCSDISMKVKAAINNNTTKHLTLSELRTSLFFYYRALRHGGEPEEARVDQLLALIRERVEDGDLR